MKQQSFFQRNSVTIVMIPALIGLHYGWSLMQKNRTLVSADEEIDLPIVTFGKYCWSKVQDLTGNKKGIETASTPASK